MTTQSPEQQRRNIKSIISKARVHMKEHLDERVIKGDIAGSIFAANRFEQACTYLLEKSESQPQPIQLGWTS